jgi:hypothetical protein
MTRFLHQPVMFAPGDKHTPPRQQEKSSLPSGIRRIGVSGGANVHQSWRFENDQAGERDRSGGVAA